MVLYPWMADVAYGCGTIESELLAQKLGGPLQPSASPRDRSLVSGMVVNHGSCQLIKVSKVYDLKDSI